MAVPVIHATLHVADCMRFCVNVANDIQKVCAMLFDDSWRLKVTCQQTIHYPCVFNAPRFLEQSNRSRNGTRKRSKIIERLVFAEGQAVLN